MYTVRERQGLRLWSAPQSSQPGVVFAMPNAHNSCHQSGSVPMKSTRVFIRVERWLRVKHVTEREKPEDPPRGCCQCPNHRATAGGLQIEPQQVTQPGTFDHARKASPFGNRTAKETQPMLSTCSRRARNNSGIPEVC